LPANGYFQDRGPVYLFSKYFHPQNFAFAEGEADGPLTVGGMPYSLETTTREDDVHHIRIHKHGEPPDGSGSENPAGPGSTGLLSRCSRNSRLVVGPDGGFSLKAGFISGSGTGDLAEGKGEEDRPGER
jgi:hypothetical protein